MPGAPDRISVEGRHQNTGLITFIDPVVHDVDVAVDLGCSYGVTTDDLQNVYQDARIVGIDVPDAFDDRTTNYEPSYIGGFCPELPIKDGKVGSVIAINSIGQIPGNMSMADEEFSRDPEDFVDRALVEMDRITSKTGRLVIASDLATSEKNIGAYSAIELKSCEEKGNWNLERYYDGLGLYDKIFSHWVDVSEVDNEIVRY